MNGLTTEYDYQLSIALDYDQTFTANRELWINFVILAKSLNSKVTFVTFRYETQNNMDIIYDAMQLDIPIVFSNGKQKSSIFNADIWIDDLPITIPSIEDIKEKIL